VNEKLTRSNAMLAKCHECCGEYTDDKEDCRVLGCPLHEWMPYKEVDSDLEWLKYNPRKKGKVTWEESKRDISDEQRAIMGERLKKARTKNEDDQDQ